MIKCRVLTTLENHEKQELQHSQKRSPRKQEHWLHMKYTGYEHTYDFRLEFSDALLIAFKLIFLRIFTLINHCN